MAETTRQTRKRFKDLIIKVKVKKKRLKIKDHKARRNKRTTKIKTKNKTQEINVKAISRSPRPCYDCEHGSSESIRNQASGVCKRFHAHMFLSIREFLLVHRSLEYLPGVGHSTPSRLLSAISMLKVKHNP
ncbi:hypothetical protein Tco_1313880 [Tanacetum coccineum]